MYEQPATAYVADFLGVANLLDAECVGSPSDGLRTIGSDRSTCRHRVARRTDPYGSSSDRSGSGCLSADSGLGEDNCVPAMVERVVYVGSVTQIYLRLTTGASLQAFVANHDGPPDWPEGTPVHVALPVDGLRAPRRLTPPPTGPRSVPSWHGVYPAEWKARVIAFLDGALRLIVR